MYWQEFLAIGKIYKKSQHRQRCRRPSGLVCGSLPHNNKTNIKGGVETYSYLEFNTIGNITISAPTAVVFFTHLSRAVLLSSVRPVMSRDILILLLYNVTVMLLAIIMTVVTTWEDGLRKIWRMFRPTGGEFVYFRIICINGSGFLGRMYCTTAFV